MINQRQIKNVIDLSNIGFESIASMKAITQTPSDLSMFMLFGSESRGDGVKNGFYYWDALNVEDNNDDSIIKVTNITTGRFIKMYLVGDCSF